MPVFSQSDSEIEGEIMGIFAADGNCCPQSQYQITFCFGLNEAKYAQSLSDEFEKYFHKKPYCFSSEKFSTIRLRYRSKTIYSRFC